MAILNLYKFINNANDSVGSFNGTAANMTYSKSYGKVGYGGYFNGSSSQISFATGFPIPHSTDFTIACWARMKTTGGMIFESEGAFWCTWIALGSTDMRFGIATTANAGYYALSTNDAYRASTKWQYVTCRRIGMTKLEYYINGVLAAEATATNVALRQNNQASRIGYFSYAAGAKWFIGDISEFLLDNTPWPVAKIKNKVALDNGFF